MPARGGQIGSGPLGLTLRAWGIINGSTGALIGNLGVASTTRAIAGVYTFTLSAATLQTAIVVTRATSSAGSFISSFGGMSSTTAGRIDTVQQLASADTSTDAVSVHFEVWA